jgi:putative ABC transport system permease protein
MSDRDQAPFAKPYCWLIHLIGVLVPRRLRADWRQEWEAELQWHEQQLAEWDRLDWRNKLDLLWHSAGAFMDALFLQPRRWEDEMFQDLRYGVRLLLKHPGFSLIAILTLALGIGANTAIFSLVNAVLLRTLPFPQPERIMTVWEAALSDGVAKQGFAPGNYSDLKAQQTVFAQMSALTSSQMNLTGEGGPEKLEGFAVLEKEALEILGVKPALGRLFLPGEYVRGANKVLLISHSFWQQRFSGAPDVLGKGLTLNDESYVVVGVLPASFEFLNPDASYWVPAGYNAPMLAYRAGHGLRVLARLKPGVTQTQAQAEIQMLMQRVARAHPAEAGKLSAFVQPLHQHLTGEVRRPLLVLLVAVGLVLLIACANLANLLLARASARRKEIAVRAALGAGRARIVRQLLTESVLLAGVGGVCGLLVATWSFAVLRQLIPPGLAASATLGLDGQVLAYTLGLAALTGVLFGLAPAWQATRVDVNEALKQGGGRAGIGQRRLQNALVVAEVALALVLLIGAGLLIQTFYRLRQVEVGFRVENVLAVQTRLPRARYLDHSKRTAFFQQTLERVRALPGVVSAAYTSELPMAGRGGIYNITIEGRPAAAGVALEAGHHQVSLDYFTTLGIPLRQGRVFDERDTLQTPGVALINETMARRFWPNESVLGKRFSIDDDIQGKPVPPLTIIGVVGDVKHQGLENDVWPELYLPYAQVTYNSYSIPSNLVIHTTVDPLNLAAAVSGAIHAADPNLPVADVRTMAAQLDELVAQRRLRMTLLTAYAGLALLLAAVGIYGVLAYFVTQHTTEIGLRMALGAQAGDVLRFVLRRGMGLAVAGVGLGLLTSLAVLRLMETLLFGVSATDPLTFGGIALLLLGVAFVACWLPARRATQVDPLTALRHE